MNEFLAIENKFKSKIWKKTFLEVLDESYPKFTSSSKDVFEINTFLDILFDAIRDVYIFQLRRRRISVKINSSVVTIEFVKTKTNNNEEERIKELTDDFFQDENFIEINLHFYHTSKDEILNISSIIDILNQDEMIRINNLFRNLFRLNINIKEHLVTIYKKLDSIKNLDKFTDIKKQLLVKERISFFNEAFAYSINLNFNNSFAPLENWEFTKIDYSTIDELFQVVKFDSLAEIFTKRKIDDELISLLKKWLLSQLKRLEMQSFIPIDSIWNYQDVYDRVNSIRLYFFEQEFISFQKTNKANFVKTFFIDRELKHFFKQAYLHIYFDKSGERGDFHNKYHLTDTECLFCSFSYTRERNKRRFKKNTSDFRFG